MTNLNYLLIYVIGLNKTLNLPFSLFYNPPYWNKFQEYKYIKNPDVTENSHLELSIKKKSINDYGILSKYFSKVKNLFFLLKIPD